ncbi:flagellar hook-associated protein FlgK [Belnapia rosea]|uniref:Flagellar hook-associated protein 1 n=1 Tax=Belnapia rosea TaxID=938405 RepID=A0A1G6P8H5_9PROT|nr:flagellar basal body rod C-terminal domain-containing protein [Belnapia rosea]SDC75786.1 flagellar hook-associated protein 1 FlgK [Belnapia rosea]
MSLELALGIARSGLAAVQRNLSQASQNVANAETPGYTRKTVAQQSLVVEELPAGLRSGETQRAVDAALLGRLDQSRGALAATTVREELLQGIEQAHGAAGDGATLGDAVAALANAFTGLRASPADAGQQRAALGAAGTIASRLNEVSAAIGAARQQAQDGILAEVTAANAALRQIASLTIQIKSGAAGDTAGLEDQRDQAIATLAESIKVQATRKPGGHLLLVARGGIVLPLDPARDVLATGPASVSPDSYHGAGGTLPGVTLGGIDITGQLAGGRLGEYIALRDRTLPRYQAETDLVAVALANRFDQEGLRLFTDSDGASVPDATLAYAGSTQIGFAGRIRLSAAVSADPSLLRNGTHAVTPTPGGPDGFLPNPPGGPAGFTTLLDRVLNYALGSEAATGNPWPTISSVGLGPDGSLASPFVPAGAIADYASSVTTAQLGDRAAATEAKRQASSLHAALETRFTATSGVDIDAEMAGMVTLQNAYAANARVLGTVQSMWEALLGSVR